MASTALYSTMQSLEAPHRPSLGLPPHPIPPLGRPSTYRATFLLLSAPRLLPLAHLPFLGPLWGLESIFLTLGRG